MFTSAKKKKEVDPILKNMEECVCFLSPRGNSVRKVSHLPILALIALIHVLHSWFQIAQITVGIHRTAFEGLIFGCPHLGRCGMQPVVHADDAGLLLYLVLPTLKVCMGEYSTSADGLVGWHKCW
uniref:Uncharacterized protein n=1 Tax=Oryza meridionalis TaxID=40149 RepID=A0A0E0EJZ8_9ORYZ